MKTRKSKIVGALVGIGAVPDPDFRGSTEDIPRGQR